MQIQEQISLKPYNTFGIDVAASQYVELRSEAQIEELSSYPGPKRVIGGGSNVLLTKPVEGLVVRNCLLGISLVEENDQHVWVQVRAGENWHRFVMYAIDHNLGGIENLSLIPGCVGASPMQNIGAYGVEVKDTITNVICWHWENGKYMNLSNADCQFGYRDSIFKRELKDKVLITSVTFRLDKIHCINTSYGAIRDQLAAVGASQPSIKNVSEAVIAIRSSKLPDPNVVGNAGSFFKNPTIPAAKFAELKEHYVDLPSYPVDEQHTKIPAGWLIEHCGWKGYRDGDAGVHPKQALVLVNYGSADGQTIYDLSSKILHSVKEKFGIDLEREVNVW